MIRGSRAWTAGLALWLCSCVGAVAAVPMQVEVSLRQADGKVVVAGQASDTSIGPHLTLGRFNADGTVDTSFGNGGWTDYSSGWWQPPTTEFRATAIAEASGWYGTSLLIAAVHDGQLALVRLTSSGQPDGSFGYGGTMVDADGAGMRVNALLVQYDGSILAIGAYSGSETNGVPAAATVRYWSGGWRDYGYGTGPQGTRIHAIGPGASELRAAMPVDFDSYVAAGYATGAGNRNFLIAKFDGSGALDASFGNGGYSLVDVLAGHDSEAFALTQDAYGRYLAVGRDGHTFFGRPQSGFAIARFDGFGHPDASFGWGGAYAADVHVYDYHDGDATAVSIAPLPGSDDVLVSGTVTEFWTGHSHFANWRASPQSLWTSYPLTAPIVADDDSMVGAYPNDAGQFVAVGTRVSAAGAVALRARYWSDTGAFDTDFPDGP